MPGGCRCQAGWLGLPLASSIPLQLQLPAASSPTGAVPAPGLAPERLRAAFVLGAAGTHVQALESSWWERDPFPALTPAHAGPSPPAQGPSRLWRAAPLAAGHPLACLESVGTVDSGCPGAARASVCPCVPAAVAITPPHAGLHSTRLPCQGLCQPSPSLPVPGRPHSPPLSHAATLCLSFPVPRVATRRVLCLSFLSPGKGRELPALLPPSPAAEPGDCDELWSCGASAGFLAPAGRLGAITRLLPAQPTRVPPFPRAAAAPQRAPRNDTGTATQTPALPCPPHCWIPGQQGRRERGEGTGQWHRWGERGGHGPGGCCAARHGPRLEKGLASSSTSGTAMSGGCPGSVPALAMPAGRPAGESPAAPRASAGCCHGAGPQHGQGPRPAALPGRGARCTGTCARSGQGMEWGSHG